MQGEHLLYYQIKQKKRKESLINNQEKAILSKKLVTLKKDVPIKNRLEEFELKNIDKNKLYSFLREMEFNRLLSSVISEYGEPDFLEKASMSHFRFISKFFWETALFTIYYFKLRLVENAMKPDKLE